MASGASGGVVMTLEDQRLTDARDAADDELLAERQAWDEGRAADHLAAEARMNDLYAPSPDDLEPWRPLFDHHGRQAS